MQIEKHEYGNLWFLSFAFLKWSFRGDMEFSDVFIITLEYGFYYCTMRFLFGSRDYSLASWWKMFPITARLDLNTAFLLAILGRKAVPKIFYLQCIPLHILKMKGQNKRRHIFFRTYRPVAKFVLLVLHISNSVNSFSNKHWCQKKHVAHCSVLQRQALLMFSRAANLGKRKLRIRIRMCSEK